MTEKDRAQWIFSRALHLLGTYDKCKGCENADCVESAAAGDCRCYDEKLAETIERVKSSKDCSLYLDDMQRITCSDSDISKAFFHIRVNATAAYHSCANAAPLKGMQKTIWAWDGSCDRPEKQVLSPYSCYGCKLYKPKEGSN